MGDRSIASRPSLEQVMIIVDFMERHPELGLSKLRGLEGRDESKRLWLQLTRLINGADGPTRPMKSWIKYWADKKNTVRSKVLGSGGDPNNLTSNIDRKIWDLFLGSNSGKASRNSVKQETHFLDETLFNEDSADQNHVDTEQEVMAFEEAPAETVECVDFEEREMAIMERLMKVMTDQASALNQLAQASHANAQAMERLADASQIQALAVGRLAGGVEAAGGAARALGAALADIDTSLKRYYPHT